MWKDNRNRLENTLGLTTYIVIVVILFILGSGGYYLFSNLSGPRKLEEIKKLMAAGKIQAAINELTKLLTGDERNLEARLLLAQGYQRIKNHSAAVLELRQCLKSGRFSNEVSELSIRSALARSLLELRNNAEAKKEYLILTTLDPKNFENYFQVGKLFFESADNNKAITYLTKAVTLNERDADSMALLGQAQYNIAAYQDSRASLLKAVQMKPDLYMAHYYLGLCLRYLQDPDWAIKEFEKAEKDSNIRVKAILGKGMVLIDQESYPVAIKELQNGLRYAATGSETEINLRYLISHAAEKCRDMHTAIENWEKIEQTKPGFKDVREKLKQYAEFRMDDSIKDFMIASNTEFESLCQRIIQQMGHQIINIKLEGDSIVRALTVEEDTGKRNYRKQQTLISITRDNMSPISEPQVREFHESMKSQNASRGIIMTTGEITPAATYYAESRPLELFDTAKLADFVRATEKNTENGSS